MSKRKIDETGLSTASSSPTPSLHMQKKRKRNSKGKSVPVEVPGYEVTETNSSNMAKRKIDVVFESDSEASSIILKRKKVKREGASDMIDKTEKRLQMREEKMREAENQNIADDYKLWQYTSFSKTPVTSTSPTESTVQENTYITGTAPTTFPQFRKLPQELRDMIWTLSILPRVVPLKYARSTTEINLPISTITTTAPIPALLHTCRESRLLALKHYTLAFDTYTAPSKIYFDFTHDTAFFRDRTLLAFTMQHHASKITHLALQNDRLSLYFHVFGWQFCALKTLEVVLHDFHDPYIQHKALSYAQMPSYTLINPLFYPTSSSSSSSLTSRRKSSDFATRMFLRKYQLLNKEEFMCGANGTLALTEDFIHEVRDNGGKGIESTIMIAGYGGRRQGLMDAIAGGAIEGVIDQGGVEVRDRLRSLGKME